MNRVTAYIRFTVGFVGLGYIALWPLTVHDSGIAAAQAAYVCAAAPLRAICLPAQAIDLSPGLHVLGSLAAVCVLIQFLWRLLQRIWRRRAARLDARKPPARQMSDNNLRLPQRQAPLRPVKPRTQFGLRGVRY